MSRPEDDDDEAQTPAPDLIHWSPRHGAVIGAGAFRPRHFPAVSVGAVALGALALGAVSIGALAIGALAIGKLGIGRARLRDVRIDRLEIGDLAVIRRAGRPF